jgi:hypothetical protein
MPEQKKPKQDKKISLHPLEFEEALKGLLTTELPPKEKKPVTKRRSRTAGKKTEKRQL